VFLRTFFAVVFILPSSARLSLAEDVPDATMIHTLRCEAGRVGEKMARDGLPADQKAIVTWSSNRTKDGAGGVGFKVPFFTIGGSADLTSQDLDEANSNGLPFNLNIANKSVCTGFKKDIIKEGVGLYDCLVNKKYTSLQTAIEGGTGSTGCHHKITLAKKLSGSLKINVWGIDAGPSGSWGDSNVYDIVIAAPPPKK